MDGTSRSIYLPTTVVSDERLQQLRERQPVNPILRLTGSIQGLVIDAVQAPESAEQLIRLMAEGSLITTRGAQIVGKLFGPIDWPSPTDGSLVHTSKVTEDETSSAVALERRLAASSALYMLAGALWSLEDGDGRLPIFGFARPDWPRVGATSRKVGWAAFIIMAATTALMSPFLVMAWRSFRGR